VRPLIEAAPGQFGNVEREGRRAMEIVSFAINLEHIGDIIDKSLCELAVKKSKRQLQFSPEGAARGS
jgi:phosphate:Na+ symporter